MTESQFKSEIRNPTSALSARYPALHTEYITAVRSVPGSSLAIDLAEYRESIVGKTPADLTNQ